MVRHQTSDGLTSEGQTSDRQTSDEDKLPTDIVRHDKCPTGMNVRRHIYRRKRPTLLKNVFVYLSVCTSFRVTSTPGVLISKPNTFLEGSHPGDDNAV